MYLPSCIYNILRCGGFLVKYEDGSGLIPVKIIPDYYITKTQRSVTMEQKDIKVGEPGFIYTSVWKKYERHVKEVWLPEGGLKNIVVVDGKNIKEDELKYLDTTYLGVSLRTLKPYDAMEGELMKRNLKLLATRKMTATYLGLTVKTITYGLCQNISKFKPEPFEYNDFGYKTAPAVKRTFAPSKVPKGHKFKATYNDSYVPADKRFSESLTYKIAGTTGKDVVVDLELPKELLPAHNKLAKKLRQYIHKTDLSYIATHKSFGSEDYILTYDTIYNVRNENHYDLERFDSSYWWSMSERDIDYWYYQRKETELIYRATKQKVLPLESVSYAWATPEDEVQPVSHNEVFDIAVKLKTDAPKDIQILNLLRAIVPEIIDNGVLNGLLGGYKYTTKESDQTGRQNRVFGNVDGLLKYPINKSIYKVPRAKAVGFKPVTRVVRGVSREYINLKDLGLTKSNEFVCLDDTRGRGFSDFKQLWIMYKVYLLLSGDLRKLTKEQKTLLNVTGIDGKTAQKLKDKIAARRTSLEYLKYIPRALGGMPEYMPSNREIASSIKHNDRIPTTLKMLQKCSTVTEYPTTMGQMFNMVHTGKRLAVGDKVNTEYVGTPRPRSAGLRCIVPDRDLTYWDGSEPIYVKAYCKSYKGHMPSLKRSFNYEHFPVNPTTYLEVTPIKQSTLDHLKWEPVYNSFPVQPVVKTTSIAWIYLNDPIVDIEESIENVMKLYRNTIKKFKLQQMLPIQKHMHNGYEVQQANTGQPHQKQVEEWSALRKYISNKLMMLELYLEGVEQQ